MFREINARDLSSLTMIARFYEVDFSTIITAISISHNVATRCALKYCGTQFALP
jgi:hypothetical protein